MIQTVLTRFAPVSPLLQFIQRTIFRRCYPNYIGIFRRKPRHGILFDLIASTSRAVHYRASRQRERNHTRYTTHRAGRCRKEFKNLRYSYRKGIDRSRIPHSTAFRQTYGSKALSLPERTDRYPQKRGQSKTNLPYYAFEGIDLRQMAEQIKSRSEKKKKARLIAAESLLFFKRHSICLSTSLVAISFDELF